jgi:hypothetical protein
VGLRDSGATLLAIRRLSLSSRRLGSPEVHDL